LSENKVYITVEDVEIAVKIINEYLKTVQRAKAALQSIQRFIGTQSYSERDLITRMVMEQMKFKTGVSAAEEEASSISEEDLERFRRIAERFKKPQTEVSSSP